LQSGFPPDDPDPPNIVSDLPAFKCGKHTTIPVSCTVTSLIPDICVFWKNLKKVLIVELTVPFELNADQAHERKVNKYAALVADIRSNGFQCDLIALEIGSRGYISPHNLKRLKQILKHTHNHTSFKEVRDNISKLAILSSFTIFHAKCEPNWDNYPFLNV
jgi:hypothetical protein